MGDPAGPEGEAKERGVGGREGPGWGQAGGGLLAPGLLKPCQALAVQVPPSTTGPGWKTRGPRECEGSGSLTLPMLSSA